MSPLVGHLLAGQPDSSPPPGVDWIAGLLDMGPVGLSAILMFVIWRLFKHYEEKLTQANDRLVELIGQHTESNIKVANSIDGVHQEMARLVDKQERFMDRLTSSMTKNEGGSS